ncbi:MAG: OmpA family protein [Acidobacteriia bacterium]|nr:OmpA family protein [Terriglobia bacterium]
MPRLNVPPDSGGAAPLIRRRYPEKRKNGAWKVAYADFVTALMSLFIVLWLMSASAGVKKSVQGYFKDPKAYSRRLGAGRADSGESLRVDHQNVHDALKRVEEALRRVPEFRTIQQNVLFTVTGEGLRIDLLETEKGMFFMTGSSVPTPAGEHLVNFLASELRKMPNEFVIEGHTDAQPFRNAVPSTLYGNWELAADRANSARRLLQGNGVDPKQIAEVRGFADRRPLNSANLNDPRNRRVSLVVKFADLGE